jgi:hypothetical protein
MRHSLRLAQRTFHEPRHRLDHFVPYVFTELFIVLELQHSLQLPPESAEVNVLRLDRERVLEKVEGPGVLTGIGLLEGTLEEAFYRSLPGRRYHGVFLVSMDGLSTLPMGGATPPYGFPSWQWPNGFR